LKVPPDSSLAPPKVDPALAEASAEDFIPNATPLPSLFALRGGKLDEGVENAIKVPVGADTFELPDFRGLAKREVLDRCAELHIQLQANGSGVAIYQQPPPGTRIPTGDSCYVTFARGGAARLHRLLEAGGEVAARQQVASGQAAIARH
jgi:hypothetical protein